MQKPLIDHLLSKKIPLFIIIDGSTEFQEYKFSIIYFRILENNCPVVDFYGLIEGSSDVTAIGLYESLSNTFNLKKKNKKDSVII